MPAHHRGRRFGTAAASGGTAVTSPSYTAVARTRPTHHARQRQCTGARTHAGASYQLHERPWTGWQIARAH
eukprot:7558167-Pyramimonas_sp.AAC.1